MQCPFCAEDVKDEAIVCKHCSSSLTVTSSLMRRVEDLSKRLSDIEADRINSAIPVTRLRLWPILLTVLIAVSLGAAVFAISDHAVSRKYDEDLIEILVNIALSLVQFSAGLSLGYFHPLIPFRKLVAFISMLVALLVLIAINVTVFGSLRGIDSELNQFQKDWHPTFGAPVQAGSIVHLITALYLINYTLEKLTVPADNVIFLTWFIGSAALLGQWVRHRKDAQRPLSAKAFASIVTGSVTIIATVSKLVPYWDIANKFLHGHK